MLGYANVGMNLLSYHWMNFVSSWNYDQAVFAVGSWLIHMVIFWGFNGFLFLCYKYEWFRRNRTERHTHSHHLDFPPNELIQDSRSFIQ
jgi:hypothetical protein